MNADYNWKMSSIKPSVFVWFSGVFFMVTLLYAFFVLAPIANDNQRIRERVANLPTSSNQLTDLLQNIETLRRSFEGESSSYRDMLHVLKFWHAEAHTYVNRLAAEAGLEVMEMEWGKPEPVSPDFETNRQRRWVRIEVFVKFLGAWEAHRNFFHGLSNCECLVQLTESKIQATSRVGQVESEMSFFIYQIDEN